MRVFSDAGGSTGCLAWSPDGRYLAEARLGPVIRVRDVATGGVERTWDESRLAGKPCLAALAFGPDGALYAHAAKQVLRYQGPVRTKLFGYQAAVQGQPRPLQVSSDGSVLLTGDGQGLDLATKRRLARAQPPDWTVDDIQFAGVALAPSGDYYAVAWDVNHSRHHAMALGIVDSRSGAYECWLTHDGGPPPDQLWFGGDSRWVCAVKDYPEEGRRLVSMFGVNALAAKFVMASETASMELPMLGVDAGGARRGSAASCGCVAAAPDGRRLFNVGGRTAEVYAAMSTGRLGWERLGGIELPIDDVVCLAVAPDGVRVAVGSRAGQVAVVEVGEGR